QPRPPGLFLLLRRAGHGQHLRLPALRERGGQPGLPAGPPLSRLSAGGRTPAGRPSPRDDARPAVVEDSGRRGDTERRQRSARLLTVAPVPRPRGAGLRRISRQEPDIPDVRTRSRPLGWAFADT